MDKHSINSNASHDSKGHETRDANIRAITIFGLVLAGLILATFISMNLLTGFFSKEKKSPAKISILADSTKDFPEPRLQVLPVQDLQKIRKEEEVWLSSYGWVDRQAGVVHMPIEDAMQILVEKFSAGDYPHPPPKIRGRVGVNQKETA